MTKDIDQDIDSFTCGKCFGHHFGTKSHKRIDGTWVILSQQCHDQFGIGCFAEWLVPTTKCNPVTTLDHYESVVRLTNTIGTIHTDIPNRSIEC